MLISARCPAAPASCILPPALRCRVFCGSAVLPPCVLLAVLLNRCRADLHHCVCGLPTSASPPFSLPRSPICFCLFIYIIGRGLEPRSPCVVKHSPIAGRFRLRFGRGKAHCSVQVRPTRSGPHLNLEPPHTRKVQGRCCRRDSVATFDGRLSGRAFPRRPLTIPHSRLGPAVFFLGAPLQLRAVLGSR